MVFIAGSGLYKKSPPEGNVLVRVCKCIGVSKSCQQLSLVCYWRIWSIKRWLMVISYSVFTSLLYAIDGIIPKRAQKGVTGWIGQKRSTRYVSVAVQAKYSKLKSCCSIYQITSRFECFYRSGSFRKLKWCSGCWFSIFHCPCFGLSLTSR